MELRRFEFWIIEEILSFIDSESTLGFMALLLDGSLLQDMIQHIITKHTTRRNMYVFFRLKNIW